MKDWVIKLGMLAIIILLTLNLFFPIHAARSAQRFQYKALSINDPNQVEATLNHVAADGWELVLCVNTAGLFVFKR